MKSVDKQPEQIKHTVGNPEEELKIEMERERERGITTRYSQDVGGRRGL